MDKQRVVDAALGDEVTYFQLTWVLGSAHRYGFTAEELELLEDCKSRLVPSRSMAVHNTEGSGKTLQAQPCGECGHCYVCQYLRITRGE